MPQSMPDMALVWYHRPDNAGPLGRKPTRALNASSWSWAAWTDVVVSRWVPEGKAIDRQHWMDKHDGQIEYWYTDANGNNLQRVDAGLQSTYWPPTGLAFSPGIHAQFLQFTTYISQDFFVTTGSMGHEIRTRKNDVIGIVYVDGGKLDSNRSFMLAQLSRAPKGNSTLDYGYGSVSMGDGDDPSDIITVKPALSAQHRGLRWVLLLAWEVGNTYRRVGVGHVHEEKGGWIAWSQQKQWIALY
jgi:hypothetical protein